MECQGRFGLDQHDRRSLFVSRAAADTPAIPPPITTTSQLLMACTLEREYHYGMAVTDANPDSFRRMDESTAEQWAHIGAGPSRTRVGSPTG